MLKYNNCLCARLVLDVNVRMYCGGGRKVSLRFATHKRKAQTLSKRQMCLMFWVEIYRA